jgi:hypothetical protein
MTNPTIKATCVCGEDYEIEPNVRYWMESMLTIPGQITYLITDDDDNEVHRCQ